MQLFTKSGVMQNGSIREITGSRHLAEIGRRAMPAALWVMAGLAVLHAAYFLWIGLFSPILDLHAFRQTQTALSAYWMLQDGLKLNYETPVLGYPWSVPFEFPTYQALVAAASYFGLSIEASGRLWSFAFFAACIWPLSIISRSLALPRYVFPATVILLFSSPIYIYWSRTVMIESCAVFFSLFWVSLVIRSAAHRSIVDLAGIVTVGSLAVMTKSTTFPAFGFLGGIFVVSILMNLYTRRDYNALFQATAFFSAACAIPLFLGFGWILYSDAVKSLNPLATSLLSGNLHRWIFGTWEQLFSRSFLKTIFWSTVDTFGYSWSFAALALCTAFKYRRARYIRYVLANALCFLLPFLVFTNLYTGHIYYHYANAIFLIIAVVMALTSIAEAGQPVAAIIMGLAIATGQILFFHSAYASLVEADQTKYNSYQIALQAKRIIPPSEGILVIGKDLPSVVFYSERKGVALTYLQSEDLIDQLLRNPGPFFGDRPLGGIVYCANPSFPFQASPMIVDFLAGRKELGAAGTCQLLSASR